MEALADGSRFQAQELRDLRQGVAQEVEEDRYITLARGQSLERCGDDRLVIKFLIARLDRRLDDGVVRGLGPFAAFSRARRRHDGSQPGKERGRVAELRQAMPSRGE